MTELRDHIETLANRNDLVRVDERVEWAETAAATASETARSNGPAVTFENTGGLVRLAAGVYGGPDQMRDRERKPWSRLADALGRPDDDYVSLVEAIGSQTLRSNDSEWPTGTLETTQRDIPLHALGLPLHVGGDVPQVTRGLLATGDERQVWWAPLRGVVRGRNHLQVTTPTTMAEALTPGTTVRVALGVPPAAQVAAQLQWADTLTGMATPQLVPPGATVPVASDTGPPVPAASEVVLEATVTDGDGTPEGPKAGWEFTIPTSSRELRVEEVTTRENPIVSFAPLGTPLSGDFQVAGFVESARLYTRLNTYWGVQPVEWVGFPAEARLGLCLVSSELLYAGFEWQLANALFSFTRHFDKVVILDQDTGPAELGRALDDIWVKADPSQDWIFSEPLNPSATAPAYQSEDATSARLTVNAAWDPQWDEEYIAPRVDFETTYPESIRDAVLERWEEMGFDSDPET